MEDTEAKGSGAADRFGGAIGARRRERIDDAAAGRQSSSDGCWPGLQSKAKAAWEEEARGREGAIVVRPVGAFDGVGIDELP